MSAVRESPARALELQYNAPGNIMPAPRSASSGRKEIARSCCGDINRGHQLWAS